MFRFSSLNNNIFHQVDTLFKTSDILETMSSDTLMKLSHQVAQLERGLQLPRVEVLQSEKQNSKWNKLGEVSS